MCEAIEIPAGGDSVFPLIDTFFEVHTYPHGLKTGYESSTILPITLKDLFHLTHLLHTSYTYCNTLLQHFIWKVRPQRGLQGICKS